MRKLSIILALLALSFGCLSKAHDVNYSHKLQVGKQKLMAEIVQTPEAMQQGLSERTSMQDNEGMLFDLGSTKKIPAFWMKDMKFNLGLIWIAEGKIIGITSNVPAPTGSGQLPTYRPPAPVNQVLEVNAGWTEKNDIKVGDEIKLND